MPSPLELPTIAHASNRTPPKLGGDDTVVYGRGQGGARCRSAMTLLLLSGVLGLAACSSGRGADAEKSDPKATPECVSYERELRACFAAVGAPVAAADTLASTLSQSDDATRLRMESACARNRVSLRASCK